MIVSVASAAVTASAENEESIKANRSANQRQGQSEDDALAALAALGGQGALAALAALGGQAALAALAALGGQAALAALGGEGALAAEGGEGGLEKGLTWK